MNGNDSTHLETKALRERNSRLSAAILRISASLDVATVLQEVVDSARAFTGARYGVIVTLDETGQPKDFVTSGFTADEHAQLAGWSDGPQFFEHLRDVPNPLRLGDLHNYVRALGFSPDLMVSSTLQGVPMRHRGEQVGNFFLAPKASGGEFTAEDEELLVLFASQAATAIVNARTHRDEQRARADLEALVETSPVGVVVFDARTGRPISRNREANRIIEALCTPGRPAEELLETMTCRFADGREVALDQFPLAAELKNAGTVRAEEIKLSVPDGRSVSMLVNATPIHAEDGTVATVVVTLQDLAPLEELDRLRAEFLGMVSHELRTPLATIRGSTRVRSRASSRRWRARPTCLRRWSGASPGTAPAWGRLRTWSPRGSAWGPSCTRDPDDARAPHRRGLDARNLPAYTQGCGGGAAKRGGAALRRCGANSRCSFPTVNTWFNFLRHSRLVVRSG